jgi:tripartite-type tricarboxylate transporter receptor subunit TctC
MRIWRRPVCGWISVLALSLLWAASGNAQQAGGGFPSRPLQLVVPYPPGGVVDPVARILALRLGSDLGQPTVVENRAGVGGSIGANYVARARPDGHTILLHTGSGLVIQQLANRNVDYDARVDFAPVSLIAAAPYVVSITPGLPVRSLLELVDLARTQPGGLFSMARLGSAPRPT